MQRADDPRLGSLVKYHSPDNAEGDLVIIGYPVDIGVERNGGRVGSRFGPSAFRKYTISGFDSITLLIHYVNLYRKLQTKGAVKNMEYEIDLRAITITDKRDAVESPTSSSTEDGGDKKQEKETD